LLILEVKKTNGFFGNLQKFVITFESLNHDNQEICGFHQQFSNKLSVNTISTMGSINLIDMNSAVSRIGLARHSDDL
jgi:hypothetical protein